MKNNHHFGLKLAKNTSYKHYRLTKEVMNAILGNFLWCLAVIWCSNKSVLPSLPPCPHCKKNPQNRYNTDFYLFQFVILTF